MRHVLLSHYSRREIYMLSMLHFWKVPWTYSSLELSCNFRSFRIILDHGRQLFTLSENKNLYKGLYLIPCNKPYGKEKKSTSFGYIMKSNYLLNWEHLTVCCKIPRLPRLYSSVEWMCACRCVCIFIQTWRSKIPSTECPENF